MHVFLRVCSKSSGPVEALDGRGAGKACRMFLDVLMFCVSCQVEVTGSQHATSVAGQLWTLQPEAIHQSCHNKQYAKCKGSSWLSIATLLHMAWCVAGPAGPRYCVCH